MTSSSNYSQSTRPTERVLGKNYSSFLDFTRNYKRTNGIFVPWSLLEYSQEGTNALSFPYMIIPKILICVTV